MVPWLAGSQPRTTCRDKVAPGSPLATPRSPLTTKVRATPLGTQSLAHHFMGHILGTGPIVPAFLLMKVQAAPHAWHRDEVFLLLLLDSGHSPAPVLQLRMLRSETGSVVLKVTQRCRWEVRTGAGVHPCGCSDCVPPALGPVSPVSYESSPTEERGRCRGGRPPPLGRGTVPGTSLRNWLSGWSC